MIDVPTVIILAIIAFIVGIIMGVLLVRPSTRPRDTDFRWQVESSRVMQPLIDWLDIRLPGVLPDYEKYYRQLVISQYRVFDVAGLRTRSSYSLDLEKVFVKRGLAPTLAQQPSPDLALVPE